MDSIQHITSCLKICCIFPSIFNIVSVLGARILEDFGQESLG